MNSEKIGIFGENIASYYLEKKGYKILDRNYTKKWSQGPKKGEIDIVAKKDNLISFVEVKTNSDKIGVCFSPEERVDFRKKRQLIKIAQNWLSDKKIPLDSRWQIDVISIKIDLNKKKAKIRHFRNSVC